MATTADKVCWVKVACICRGKLKLIMYLLLPRSKMSRPKWPVSWQTRPFPVKQIQEISPVLFRDAEEQGNIVSFGATESETCKAAQRVINSLIEWRGRRLWVWSKDVVEKSLMILMHFSWLRCRQDWSRQCRIHRVSVCWEKHAHEQTDRPALRGFGMPKALEFSRYWSLAVAAYEFTTLTTVPGQVQYNGAAIQMLDLPGIIQGAKDGKGRGRQVIAVAKTCHLIFIVLDVNKPLTDKKVIEAELEGFGIRINKEPPNIVFKKKDKGGISITNTVPLTHIEPEVRFIGWRGGVLVLTWDRKSRLLWASIRSRQQISLFDATPPLTTL